MYLDACPVNQERNMTVTKSVENAEKAQSNTPNTIYGDLTRLSNEELQIAYETSLSHIKVSQEAVTQIEAELAKRAKMN